MDILLVSLFEYTDIYLLIVVRMLGFFTIMPIFSGKSVPNITKVGLSVIVAGIIFSTQQVGPVQYNDNIIGYSLLIVKELAVGLLMGYSVYMVFSALYLAGQLVDYQIGFSMVSVFDPVSQIQVPVTGNLYYFLVGALMVATNADHTIFRALFYSYQVLPIGYAEVFSAELMSNFMNVIAEYFIIAFKISMPVLGAIMVINTALGLMARTAPRINIFSVGVPLKLIAGLMILLITTDMFNPISDFVFQKVYENLFNVIQGMIP